MLEMKTDIRDRNDIQKLVAVFYEHLLQDEEFKHLFLDVAQVNMLDHLDLLIDFWESVLFQAGKYKRDPLQAHLDVNQKYHYGLNDSHFNRWLQVFNETVDSLFEGEKATGAKDRARSIATIIKMKIDQMERQRKTFNN